MIKWLFACFGVDGWTLKTSQELFLVGLHVAPIPPRSIQSFWLLLGVLVDLQCCFRCLESTGGVLSSLFDDLFALLDRVLVLL